MSLTDEGVPDRGLRLGLGFGALVGIKVVDQAGARPLQDAVGIVERIGEVRSNGGIVEVRLEAIQRVAFDRGRRRLAHDRRADDESQCVEGGHGAVAVGVGDLARLQRAVVIPRGNDIVDGIAHLDRH